MHFQSLSATASHSLSDIETRLIPMTGKMLKVVFCWRHCKMLIQVFRKAYYLPQNGDHLSFLY